MSEVGAGEMLSGHTLVDVSKQMVVFGEDPKIDLKRDSEEEKAQKAAKNAKNAEKILNGAIFISQEYKNKILSDNELRNDKEAETDTLSLDELLVLTALGEKVYLKGVGLSTDDVKQRLEQAAEQTVTTLTQSLRAEAGIDRRMLEGLNRFRKQLTELTPSPKAEASPSVDTM